MDSSMGPMRIVYSPNTEFTLMVEMHRSMFSAKVISPAWEDEPGQGPMDPEEASRRISEIDERIKELDEERAALVAERNSIVVTVDDSATEERATDGNVRKTIEREV